MAFSDYFYSAGTCSIAAGSKDLTGDGTAWQLNDTAGALLIVGQDIGFVANATAENAAQLVDDWSGSTKVDQPYRMWLVPADAATNLTNHTRLAQIIASITGAQSESDILTALANLDASADKLAFFNSPSTMALVDFKAWARSFLGLTAAANKIAYLTSTTTMALADFKVWAVSMLGLTVAANKAVYFTDANTAALYDLTAAGRALAGAANAAAQKTALSLVKADVGLGSVDNTADTAKPVSTAQAAALLAKAGGAMSGPLDIAYTVDGNFGIRFTQTYNIASGGTLRIGTEGSGFLVATSHTDGSTAIYVVGGGGVVLVSQTGTVFGRTSDGGGMKLQYAAAPTGYYFGNVTGVPHTLGIAFLRTRPQA